MAYASLLPFDDFTNREWHEYISNIEDTITFCQLLGLIAVTPRSPCGKDHHNWYLSATKRYQDNDNWRCRTYRSNRSIRDEIFFLQSKVTRQQILDLMFYWSQSLDSHEYLYGHCRFTSESTIVNWKSITPEIYILSFLRFSCTIARPDHVVEIDESDWTKR
ncbi:unnamed protein product, partial [Rotaria sp. Silwood2]